MLNNLLVKGEFDGRLRELIIMRIGCATGAVYDWTQHRRVATGMDIPEADLLGVLDWQNRDSFGPAERAVLAATDDSLATSVIGEEAWVACPGGLDDEAALLELVAVIADWTLFSSLLRSLEVPWKTGSSPAPDGRAP